MSTVSFPGGQKKVVHVGKDETKRCTRNDGCVEKKHVTGWKVWESLRRKGLKLMSYTLTWIKKKCQVLFSLLHSVLMIKCALSFIPRLIWLCSVLCGSGSKVNALPLFLSVSLTDLEQRPRRNTDGTKTSWSYYAFRIMSGLISWQCNGKCLTFCMAAEFEFANSIFFSHRCSLLSLLLQWNNRIKILFEWGIAMS